MLLYNIHSVNRNEKAKIIAPVKKCVEFIQIGHPSQIYGKSSLKETWSISNFQNRRSISATVVYLHNQYLNSWTIVSKWMLPILTLSKHSIELKTQYFCINLFSVVFVCRKYCLWTRIHRKLVFCGPQRSNLEPLLYALCINDLSAAIYCERHFFADTLQIICLNALIMFA